MTVEIDETTGLPVLPDGDFWRVVQFTRSGLQLQRRRQRLFGSRTVGEGLIHLDHREFGTPEEQILKVARKIMLTADGSGLLGDYPPKRLQP